MSEATTGARRERWQRDGWAHLAQGPASGRQCRAVYVANRAKHGREACRRRPARRPGAVRSDAGRIGAKRRRDTPNHRQLGSGPYPEKSPGPHFFNFLRRKCQRRLAFVWYWSDRKQKQANTRRPAPSSMLWRIWTDRGFGTAGTRTGVTTWPIDLTRNADTRDAMRSSRVDAAHNTRQPIHHATALPHAATVAPGKRNGRPTCKTIPSASGVDDLQNMSITLFHSVKADPTIS